MRIDRQRNYSLRISFALAAAAALLLMPVLGLAQNNDQSQNRSNNLSAQDRQFVQKAAHAGKAEVKMGKLAKERAQNEEVRDFADHMVEDHTTANEKLMEIARDKGVTLPSGMDEKHRQKHEKLSGLSGAEFDRHYMKTQVKAHEKVLDLYRKQAKNGQDEDLREYAEDTVPTLEDHLDEARDVREELRDQD